LVLLTSEAGATSDALGLLLAVSAVALLVPASAAAASKLVPAAVLVTTAARFAATGVYELSASGTWKTIAGVTGIALCAIAVYAAAALALEDAQHRTILPIGRRGAASLDAGPGAALDREAGVRDQL
jgi:succinate-acetate transporter protein